MDGPVTSGADSWVRPAVQEHERPLLLYAARLLGDAERARDVVQEVFLRLCRERPEDVEPVLVRWLFTVCRNLALDRLRKEQRMAPMSEAARDEMRDPAPSPAAVLEHAEIASAIVRALATLPPDQEEVLRLKFQQGFSYREISAVTGHTVTNVGFLIHVGMTRLRAAMAAGQKEGVRS